ncbi:MAG TPA: BON domain-containing protein [Bryobacteraceae bacterium]|nr:BON domain-containing protein [Bryobacteraceae bacterium]
MSYRCLAPIVLALTIGCAHAATKSAAVPKAKPASIPDATIEKAIRARFSASKISTHHFQVHVQGGVATIEGQTDVLQHKGTATRLAKSAGAIKVVNKVAVSAAAKEKAAKNLASGRRRAQIKRSEVTARTAKRAT